MKDLAGKTAFVTGAASGIDWGSPLRWHRPGVKVMLCDIEEAALAKALEVKAARSSGGVSPVTLKNPSIRFFRFRRLTLSWLASTIAKSASRRSWNMVTSD